MATNKSRKTHETSNPREASSHADRRTRYTFSNKTVGRVVHAGLTGRMRTAGAKSVGHSSANLSMRSTRANHKALVQRATRSAIKLHRDALKELERY